MKKTVSNFLRAAAVTAGAALFASAPAKAGLFDTDPAPGGFYISGFGGASFLQDSSFNGIADPVAGVPGPTGVAGTPLDLNLSVEAGLTFGGAIGVQLPFKYLTIFHPRLEIEGSAISREIEGGSFNGGNQIFGGDQDITFVYLNNYSDIIFSEDQRIIPYVGGGFGLGFVDSNVNYFPPTATAPTFAVQGNDTAFASHIAAGATIRLSDNLDLYAEGRYFRVINARLDRNFVGGGANLLSGEVEDDIDGLTATGGIRFRF